MADLPFNAYAPHPSIPGAYNFTPSAGGDPMLFGGDEADRLRKVIDLSPQPQMLAGNGDMSVDPNANASMAPMQSSISPQDLASAAADKASTPAPQAPQEAAQEGVPVRNAPTASAGAAGSAPSVEAPHLSDLDKMVTYTHTKPHMQLSGTKTTTQDAMSPELAKLYTQAFVDKQKADASSAELQKMHLEAQRDASAIAAADAAKKQDDLEKDALQRRATLQTGADEFNRIMSAQQKDLSNASAREVDQYRMYRGKPGAQIGAAIAGALGAFGSSLTHGPNFALDIINKQIDNDVQAQREEITRGVAAKQNDIQRIKDKYNVDTSVAEKLLSINLTDTAAQAARKQAALIGGQEAQAKLDSLQSGLAQRRMADVQALQQAVYGKSAQEATEKFVAGGTSVGLTPQAKGRALAAETFGKTAEALGKGTAGEYQATHEGMTPAQAAKANGKGGKAPARLAGQRAIQDAAIDDIDNFLKERPKGYIRPQFPGENAVVGRGLTSNARDAVDTKATAIVGKAVQASNGSINEHEAQHFLELLTSPYESVAHAAAAEIKRAVETSRKGIDRAIESAKGNGGVEDAIQEAATEAAP